MDLFEAIRLQQVAEVRRLLAAGTDPDARDARGTPAIVLALDAATFPGAGDPAVLRLLRAAGADPAPLEAALRRQLAALPAVLARLHDDVGGALLVQVPRLHAVAADLAPVERDDLGVFARDAQAFFADSDALRAEAGRLHARFGSDDVDAAVDLLTRVAGFELRATGLAVRLEALVHRFVPDR
jgi:hypothetical protein